MSTVAARLRKLEAQATPGPWFPANPGGHGWYVNGPPIEDGSLRGDQVADLGYSERDNTHADAALIASARNLLPLLADLAEAMEEVHEFQCGCDRPGSQAKCVAKPEGTFAALARVAELLDHEEGTT